MSFIVVNAFERYYENIQLKDTSTFLNDMNVQELKEQWHQHFRINEKENNMSFLDPLHIQLCKDIMSVWYNVSTSMILSSDIGPKTTKNKVYISIIVWQQIGECLFYTWGDIFPIHEKLPFVYEIIVNYYLFLCKHRDHTYFPDPRSILGISQKCDQFVSLNLRFLTFELAEQQYMLINYEQAIKDHIDIFKRTFEVCIANNGFDIIKSFIIYFEYDLEKPVSLRYILPIPWRELFLKSPHNLKVWLNDTFPHYLYESK